MRHILIIFLCTFLSSTYAQNPSYFSYNIENGAPSNEIYCIMQDNAGYVWIGCDAGVYRFNGVRYEQFTSSELTARSATGLIQTTNGRIYGYNFNRQLFYIENGKLNVIRSWKLPVNGIAHDKMGHIWVTSSEGIFRIREKDLFIETIRSKYHVGRGNKLFTSHAISNEKGNIYYHNGDKILIWKKGVDNAVRLNKKYFNVPLCLSRSSEHPWIFDMTGENIFRFENGAYHKFINDELLLTLKGRKINCIFETSDNKLWIGTYTGLVCFDITTGYTELMYDQLSFSNGLRDTEGNFWFSTLHNGIIRIPQMNVRIWNTLGENNNLDQYSHISIGRDKLFFGGATGFISELNPYSFNLVKHLHEPRSDIGMLYLDPISNTVLFNKMNNIFGFHNGHFKIINKGARPIKSILHTSGGYFMLSSQGLFYTKTIEEPLSRMNLIEEDWYRDICASPFSSDYFAASNSGLTILKPVGREYRILKKILKGKQIISVSSDNHSKSIYILSFEGIIYQLDKELRSKVFSKLKGDVRANQLRVFKGKVFLATNKGILMIDPKNGKEILFDRFAGLESNNIRSIAFDGTNCWAVGEGIQRIPLRLFVFHESPGKIIPRGLLVNGFLKTSKTVYELDYNDKLSLLADGLSYRSNGNFQFAYRIKGYNETWIKVPGTVDRIDLAALPTGNLTIELKLIDHNGSDSVNTLTYNLYVKPPFWQRWWFYLFIALFVGLAAYLVFKRRESILKNKQIRELKNLRLENELRLTQQNALKAQMNPHFLFNVLNSIKGFIYQNDKKNAAKYLSDFSNLVRKVLEMSSLPKVSLAQEIEVLKLYIDLEAMLLESDFNYEVQVDESIDSSFVFIPALLIQPYVENAFKHGLRHKIGTKQLKIHFSYQEEILKVEIRDNGIGRKAAAEINSQNQSSHNSFATSAMEKRLQLLNHEKANMVGVEIVDNFEGENASGTTVILKIHV